MRRSAGSMALGRLVAATTLRWHPGPMQQYASAHGSCRRCWVTLVKAAGVGSHIVPSLLSFSGSQQCAGRLVTAEQQGGFLYNGSGADCGGAPEWHAAPSSSVSSWATTRASCGCCPLRTGARESSSSRKMRVGCFLFACSLASSKASRRCFSDSPGIRQHLQ